MTSGDTATELRLFNLGDHFQSAFQSLRLKLRASRMRLASKQASAELMAGIFALTVAGASLLAVAWRALGSDLTLGISPCSTRRFSKACG